MDERAWFLVVGIVGGAVSALKAFAGFGVETPHGQDLAVTRFLRGRDQIQERIARIEARLALVAGRK
jgi:hypothetical protein